MITGRSIHMLNCNVNTFKLNCTDLKSYQAHFIIIILLNKFNNTSSNLTTAKSAKYKHTKRSTMQQTKSIVIYHCSKLKVLSVFVDI